MCWCRVRGRFATEQERLKQKREGFRDSEVFICRGDETALPIRFIHAGSEAEIELVSYLRTKMKEALRSSCLRNEVPGSPLAKRLQKFKNIEQVRLS